MTPQNNATLSHSAALPDQYAVFIIDHADTKDYVAQWYQQNVDISPQHITVFAGTEYSHWAEIGVGPQLLYTPAVSELFDLAKQQIEQQDDGVIFYTSASFDEVCTWAQQAVSVASEHGPALCRFFEVNFILSAPHVLGELRFWQHLSPMHEVNLCHQGAWLRQQPSAQYTVSDAANELFITQHEMEQFSELRQQRLYQQLAETYRAHIPTTDVVQWVQTQCQPAQAYGFDTRHLLEQWLRAVLHYGENFYQHRDIQLYLKQTEFTPSERWELIEQALTTANAD